MLAARSNAVGLQTRRSLSHAQSLRANGMHTANRPTAGTGTVSAGLRETIGLLRWPHRRLGWDSWAFNIKGEATNRKQAAAVDSGAYRLLEGTPKK